jgi:hypothetical protein
LSLKYLKSDDRKIAALIAAFVKDGSVDRVSRLLAYICLLDVSRCPVDEYPDMATFRFPEDVNWHLVDGYSCKGKRASVQIWDRWINIWDRWMNRDD